MISAGCSKGTVWPWPRGSGPGEFVRLVVITFPFVASAEAIWQGMGLWMGSLDDAFTWIRESLSYLGCWAPAYPTTPPRGNRLPVPMQRGRAMMGGSMRQAGTPRAQGGRSRSFRWWSSGPDLQPRPWRHGLHSAAHGPVPASGHASLVGCLDRSRRARPPVLGLRVNERPPTGWAFVGQGPGGVGR